ncbi:ATP-dependent DNA ligase [Cytophaga hutchinsonii]|uniref:DNA ligase (ATP) n=1 Tax=Cytophaga hutchinsonii (strain ATCC 33406 / DSM 1761 / CIP 103989 / NBRC 15051 / NCIMB 9469 / D465) TaxID=269798 RepID=A0A6N4SW33_CYTH3|nr:ATP-dependent DNA ligase [Cytophaga hutchinsonii]ABG60757.1 ATP-dependent DNA ligase [Cytophaga hutchinsonii ATCC 33406]SFX71261.1 DNA ligase-1 [Cytophaga hutchinsonii ATCC 33406]
MKKFAELFTELDQTTRTNAKIDALADYFAVSDAADALWAVALLTGKKPKRTVKTSELKLWSMELSGVNEWLFEESYHVVGDLAETITLLLPAAETQADYSLSGMMALLKTLDTKTEEQRKNIIQEIWMQLSTAERFVFNKLITGSFRVGVSQQLVIKALAKNYKLVESNVAHRLMGNWLPDTSTLDNLLFNTDIQEDLSKPYPFYLAYQLDVPAETLGDITAWQIEYKYDGIRGQIIVRRGELFVWSRGEELMTDKFPEFERLKEALPDGTVIDGEILPFNGNEPMPFHIMQTRIGRKNLSKKSLADAPLAMMCYDLLEYKGNDVRLLPMSERRALLENLLKELAEKNSAAAAVLKLSPVFVCKTVEEMVLLRLASRDRMCEGLMLKHKDSLYEAGRRRGKWWKWKIDPLTVDGVLLYAQRGHGRRADLYTDYTFAVWSGEELVPFAKAYSGLTDKELVEVDNWVKKNTKEKFGPVRSVTPELVFEIAFEGINPSPRHKSGVALRFPRILRWRKDKGIKDANSKEDLLHLIQQLNRTA